MVRELKERGSVRDRECICLRRNGQEYTVLMSAQPITVQGEKLLLTSAIDITERKRAEQALRKTAEELGRSNKELEQFAYIASHDLQEPLRMVHGFMERLVARYGSALDDKAKEYIGFAVEGAQRMSQLVRDLLEYSRVQQRTRELTTVDTRAVFEKVLRLCTAGIHEVKASVTCQNLPVVRADELQLTQLLQNLIGNAIKFSLPGRKPQIQVGARREGKDWLFWVQDNGIGIPADQFERIFLIFQRLHTRDQYPGTGMGLAICKKIVERQDGRIWVESEVGKGSKFLFTLPADGTQAGAS